MQKNQKARLLNGNGQPKESENDRILRESQAAAELGKTLFSKFRFDLPDSEPISGDVDAESGGDSFSRAILAEVREQHSDQLREYIDSLTDRAERWKKASKALISLYLDQFLAWVEYFAQGNDIVLTHNKKHSLKLEPKEALLGSAKQLLLALGKVSNSLLFGRKTDGDKKDSIFEMPGKVHKIAGFSGGNDSGLKSLAEVRQVTLDSDGVIRKAIELIGELANQINLRRWESAGLTFQCLTGQRKVEGFSSAFNFDEEMIICFAQARIYGLLASGAEEQIKVAQKALKDRKKLAALTESEKERMASIRKDLQIAANRAASQSEASQATPLVSEPKMMAITPESRARKRIEKAIFSVFPSISDEDLEYYSEIGFEKFPSIAEDDFEFTPVIEWLETEKEAEEVKTVATA